MVIFFFLEIDGLVSLEEKFNVDNFKKLLVDFDVFRFEEIEVYFFKFKLE